LALSARHLRLAAEQIPGSAGNAYGVILEEGFGVEKDVFEAARYYERAAFAGDVDGMNNYGLCFEFGKGVPVDLYRAAKLYKSAADKGHAGAQYNYGFCLQYGIGVEIDFVESAAYFKQSADQKHRSGSFHYALCLHYGIGVEIDFGEALKYYEFAFSAGPLPLRSNSFRCLRALNRASFSRCQFGDRSTFGLQVLEQCTQLRSFTAPTLVSDYVIEKPFSTAGFLIGSGGSSRVTLETDPLDNRQYAVKHFHSESVDRSIFIREVELLTRLNHPCVLRILGWSFPRESTNAKIYMEFAANGSLESLMKRVESGSSFDFWTPTGKGIIICGILLGMRFVHIHGILHRDLKPSNILINKFGHSMISDFGSGRYESDDATLTPEAGTLYYAAPEQYKDGPYTNKVDIFSFGLILYEILVGSAVFPRSMYPRPLMKRLLRGEMPSIPDSCGIFMQGLIPRCWSMIPANRPSFEDIFIEFQAAQFDIVAGADAHLVGGYSCGVLAWEIQAASSHCDIGIGDR
jgi:hypothetical protein